MVEPRPATPFDAYRDALAAAARRTGGRVVLEVDEPATHLVVRMAPHDALLQHVSTALDVPLPREPGHVAVGTDPAVRALRLGPDEWLVVAPLEDRVALLRRAETARGTDHLSVVDVSAARCAVTVQGSAARDVLATGTGVDLDPRVLGPGRCAQTLLGRVAVLLEPLAEQGYRITTRPSFAGYLAEWLIDAAEEHTLPSIGR